MARIIITIAPNGTSKVEVQDVAGAGCYSLTQGIEKALGKTTGDDKKPDYSAVDCTLPEQQDAQQWQF